MKAKILTLIVATASLPPLFRTRGMGLAEMH